MQHAPAPRSFTGRRFLVVDDDFMVALHMETLLQELGCEVVGPVATIEEALALVLDERLDGALLDANLKGKSSGPIAEALRQRAIPFIVVTGYGKIVLESGTLNGAPRLSKPFTAKDLEDGLTAMLAQ